MSAQNEDSATIESRHQDVTLYVLPSTDERGFDATRVLPTKGSEFQLYQDGIFALSGNEKELHDLCLEWGNSVSKSQLDTVRCCMIVGKESPSPGQLMHSQSLRQLVDWVEGQWLECVLQSERLVTYFQPIVQNDEPSRIFAHECLVRGHEKDGRIISPARLFDAARATGRVARLDHAARLKAIETSSDNKLATCVFINFNPRYLDESCQYLEATFAAARRSTIPPQRFVFEVVESDEIKDVGRLMQIVQFCRDAGCRVALDDMGTGYNSLYLMSAVKPDFIKLDRDLIRDAHQDTYKSRIAAKLIELAKELEIETVVEGIETEASWQWALEQRAEYGQGFFFARPTPDPVDADGLLLPASSFS